MSFNFMTAITICNDLQHAFSIYYCSLLSGKCLINRISRLKWYMNLGLLNENPTISHHWVIKAEMMSKVTFFPDGWVH